MQNLGILDAIDLWWGGQKLDNVAVYGWPMVWWARLGKYMQILSTLTGMLELSKAQWAHHNEGIRRLSDNVGKTVGKYSPLAMAMCALVGWIPLLLAALAFLIPLHTVYAFRLLAYLGERFADSNSLRWVTLVMLMCGFQLDLLGS